MTGYDDCKNLEIPADSGEDTANTNCCYLYIKGTSNGVSDENGQCMSLSTEFEKIMRESLNLQVQSGTPNEEGFVLEKYELICRTSDQTGSQSPTQNGTVNEDSSSSIKNLTFKDKNYLFILFLSLLFVLF